MTDTGSEGRSRPDEVPDSPAFVSLSRRQSQLLDILLILATVGLTIVVVGMLGKIFFDFGDVILTFFLVNAVMNAGISGKASVPGGLAIGLTLTFCILMGGPLTGASLNPARSIGPAVATGNFGDLWVYLVGPALGGVAAGLLYKFVYEEHPRKK